MHTRLAVVGATITLVFPLIASAQSMQPSSSDPPICQVTALLASGLTSPDVTILQNFLSTQGFFHQASTGYFGAITKAALIAFQDATGISAAAGGNGVYGPYTKSYVGAHFCPNTYNHDSISCPLFNIPQPTDVCPNGGQWQTFSNQQGCRVGWQCVAGTQTTTYSLTASPLNGPAPLSTIFSGNVSGANFYGGVLLNFGDGASVTFCPASTLCGQQSYAHTYQAAGSYTAALIGVGPSGNTTLITTGLAVTSGVSTSTANSTLTATPSSGAIPLTVSFSAINLPISNTYAIDFGDTSSTTMSLSCGTTLCSGSASHTYDTDGTYTATLSNATTGATLGTATIHAGSTATSCVALTHDLVQGDTDANTNGDVSRLQQFLAQDATIYPEGLITGFFGPATQRAINRFTAATHGPIRCDAKSFAADPTRGQSPLTVTFSAKNIDETYFLDFDDNAQGNFTHSTCSGSTCTYTATHTYTNTASTTATSTAKLEHSSATATTVVGLAPIIILPATATSTPPVTTDQCVALINKPVQGDTDSTTDGDVTRLQTFLAQDPAIYPEGFVTGVFGPATQRAVNRFITAHGNLPRCDAKSFKADPTSGFAPLSVTLSAQGVDEAYFLDFGDHSQGDFTVVDCGTAAATSSGCLYSAPHTYSKPGTYFAKLDLQTATSAAITVGLAKITIATSTPSLYATPPSGTSPLSVTFTGRSVGSASSTIDFGDGQTGSPALFTPVCPNVTTDPSNPCTLGGPNLTITHTYSVASSSSATTTTFLAALKLTSGQSIATTSVMLVSSSTPCAGLTLDLQLGNSDADSKGQVSILQSFLKAQGATIYPEGLVTGTFGPATQRAVRAFQKAYNISQTGFVGPLTRATIQKICTNISVPHTKYSFKAKPASGQAPLAVTFTANNVETLSDTDYVVDFGDATTSSTDGSRATMDEDSDNTFTVDHTYTTGGTFTAKLLLEENLCGGDTGYGCVRDLQVDQATVTVTAPVVDVCPNIEGVQTSVPSGMTKDSGGNCVFPKAPPGAAPPPQAPSAKLCGLFINNPGPGFNVGGKAIQTALSESILSYVGAHGGWTSTRYFFVPDTSDQIPSGTNPGTGSIHTHTMTGTIWFDNMDGWLVPAPYAHDVPSCYGNPLSSGQCMVSIPNAGCFQASMSDSIE